MHGGDKHCMQKFSLETRSFERPRSKWGSTEIDSDGADWTVLAQDRDKWRAFVNCWKFLF
jgi:hypothetical protein